MFHVYMTHFDRRMLVRSYSDKREAETAAEQMYRELGLRFSETQLPVFEVVE